MKTLIFGIILITILRQKLVHTQSATEREEDEEHVDNRLKHYVQRFDIINKKIDAKYVTDLKNLKEKFQQSLKKDTKKQKLLLLKEYDTQLNKEFAEYLLNELDKQYINEDILIHQWYVQELLPHISDKLSVEGRKFLDLIKDALSSRDVEVKFDLFTNAADSLSDDFWNYFNGDPEPVPVLDAHLKFFQEYIPYLLQECVVDKFENDLKMLLKDVEIALKSQDEKEKLRVLDRFDDMSTELGVFINEKVIGYEIYKFGE